MDIETVVIAGAGPAGLTAAIYAARAGLQPLILEGLTPGGQLVVSEAVENYPGFPLPITGTELMDRFYKQAARFGVRFQKGAIETVLKGKGYYDIRTKNGIIHTKTLIIATGAEAKRLTVPGESVFYGKGVSGCVTCDGSFFVDKKVLVIGGGNTAIQDALYLTRFASLVTIVHRRAQFRAEEYELEKARKNPKIEWMLPWIVTEILGSDVLSGVKVQNTETNEVRTVGCDGVFVAIGHDPKTNAFGSVVEIDKQGFIAIEPGTTKTSEPGIFACGDVCDLVYKQAAVAVGQGCMAALDAQKFLSKEN